MSKRYTAEIKPPVWFIMGERADMEYPTPMMLHLNNKDGCVLLSCDEQSAIKTVKTIKKLFKHEPTDISLVRLDNLEDVMVTIDMMKSCDVYGAFTDVRAVDEEVITYYTYFDNMRLIECGRN